MGYAGSTKRRRQHHRWLLALGAARNGGGLLTPFTKPDSRRPVRPELFIDTNFKGTPIWSTSSFGAATVTSPKEMSALEAHLACCKGSRGRLFTLHCTAETMHSFVASRFLTMLVVVALLIGIASLIS